MDYKFRVKLPVTKVKSPIVVKRGVIKVNVPKPKTDLSRTSVPKAKPISEKPLLINRSTPSINKVENKRLDSKTINKLHTKNRLNQQQNNSKPKFVQTAYNDRIQSLLNSGSGRVLIMIACGPSINEVDFSRIINNPQIDVMIINKPIPSVNSPKYWCFCDDSQHQRNKGYYDNYNGSIITSVGVKASKHNHIKLNAIKGVGWSNNMLDGIVIGRSSTYSFMQMSIWMNYNKVFIFGCDMSEVNGQMHHYGVNPDVDPKVRATRFKLEAKSYEYAAKHLSKEIRSKFYFCSEYNKFSFVDEFNRLNHKNAIDFILSILK